MISPGMALPKETNKHFLQGVVDLSRTHEVEVSEDVFAQNGMKLVARGTKVSPEFYERIVSHKLAKPIESALTASGAESTDDYCREAERLLDELPLVRAVCHWNHGRVTPLGMLGQMRFNAQATTLLAVAHQRSAGQLRHDVLVSMLAMGLANAHRYNDAQLLSAVGVAGLFHDIGESYIDPDLLKGGRPLTPREWMSYSAHPIIGAALAREIAGLDPLVQKGILEHHERLDGFGYPRSLAKDAFSSAGRILALAETLSALVSKPTANRRIDIALKIMPGEYEPEMVSLMSELLGDQAGELPSLSQEAELVHASIHEVFIRIANVMGVYDAVMGSARSISQRGRDIVDETIDRFARVQRAFASTGIAELAGIGAVLSEAERVELQFEACCVLDEIAWRLMKLSRELALKAAGLNENERAIVMPLVDALSGGAVQPALDMAVA